MRLKIFFSWGWSWSTNRAIDIGHRILTHSHPYSLEAWLFKKNNSVEIFENSLELTIVMMSNEFRIWIFYTLFFFHQTLCNDSREQWTLQKSEMKSCFNRFGSTPLGLLHTIQVLKCFLFLSFFSKVVSSQPLFLMYIYLHSTLKPIKCNLCGKIFITSRELE